MQNPPFAPREIGRVERTLFMIDWVLDADMQRRTQIGLNKGESHHALKNALPIGQKTLNPLSIGFRPQPEQTPHLRFESIHPFSDGNGRIGRAIIKQVFAQTVALAGKAHG